jgi:hypothetical protein
MLEDGPDHRRVFDAADDPHGALTLRTDQRIDLPVLRRDRPSYFLNKSRPVPPEDFFISLGFEDAGDSLVAAFFLSFTP